MSIPRTGLTIINQTFTGDTKANILANILNNLVAAGWTNVNNAVVPTTVTITIASPGVITLSAGSAPVADSRVLFRTTGALPTGIVAGTTYFIKSPSGAAFNIAATAGGAAINTSGSQSGVHTATFELLMETLTTPAPQSLKMRFRFRDNNGTCVQISMENSGGSQVGLNDSNNGTHLLPAALKVWRIIAGAYYFWLLVPGRYSTDREFAFGGVPWLPSFLASGVIYEAGYLCGLCVNDTSTTVPFAFRNFFTCAQQNAVGNQQLLVNGSFLNHANNIDNSSNSGCKLQPWAPPGTSYYSNQVVRRFHDGSFVSWDPWVAWSSINGDADPRVRGMMWDTVFVNDNSISGDTVATFDGNTWFAISNLQSPTTWVITA